MIDNVNHPAHYASGKIEVIEALEDWRLDFHSANAVKYIARAGKKDATKEVEDLEKAVWYLKRKIENIRAAREGREAVKPKAMGSVRREWTPYLCACPLDQPEHLEFCTLRESWPDPFGNGRPFWALDGHSRLDGDRLVIDLLGYRPGEVVNKSLTMIVAVNE